MSSRWIVLGAVGFLVAGYVVYGRFVSAVLGVDPAKPTPAHTLRDGVDFVPARHWLVLFGHHFSSICAAGPIVGPALAVAYWGWAPSLAWILLGGVLFGAVADFSSLVVAVRHGGVSISEVTGRVVSRRARVLFSVFILVALVLVLAVFAVLTAGTFSQSPEIVIPSWGILPIASATGWALYARKRAVGSRAFVWLTVGGLAALAGLMAAGRALPVTMPGIGSVSPATVWIGLLFAYCLVASIVPVQYLLQPRDYLSSWVLFATVGLGVTGILVAGPSMRATAFNGFLPADWPIAGPLWPLMFVTIACGAISGFHSVVASGTTCKQLDSEAHACRIGYGAMLLESLVAVLVLVAVGAGLSVGRHAELLRAPGGAITAFGEGYGSLTAWALGDYGAPFAVMALNFFILTTLDTATRLGRYLLQELTGWRSRVLPTVLVLAAAGALALTGRWRAIWPVFGASNQLVAALALLIVSCWLLASRRAARATLIPSLAMLATTIGALVWQVVEALGAVDATTGEAAPRWLVAALDVVLILLAVVVATEAWQILRRRDAPARA